MIKRPNKKSEVNRPQKKILKLKKLESQKCKTREVAPQTILLQSPNWSLQQTSPLGLVPGHSVLRPPETLTPKDAVSFPMIEMISDPGAYETSGPPDHPGRQQQVRVAAPGPGRGAASHTTARRGSSSVVGYFF